MTSVPTMIDDAFVPEHFMNRELSWLEFNARVLEEAEDETNPLLERVKFLSIFSSNLDEFFMVRVAGLREQAFGDSAPQDFSPDGLRAIAQLDMISKRTHELVAAQYHCWSEQVLPQLGEHGIRLLKYEDLSSKQLRTLERFFDKHAFPILTPMAVDPSHPSTRYHNRGIYLMSMLQRRSGLGPRKMFAVVQLPSVLPRLVPIDSKDPRKFILLEDAVAARLPDLFGGFEVQSSTTFRITRDSDIELLNQESDDMLRLIEARLRARQRGDAVRLEVVADADQRLVQEIIDSEEIKESNGGALGAYDEVYGIAGPIDMTGMMGLLDIPDAHELRDPPFTPRPPRGLQQGQNEDLFTKIARQDILLHHPYDSFDSVVEFVSRAANDPNVLAIKQTLYRTSGDSPITRALIQAAENGKHVTALVELKARFDEQNNVTWARQLERAGVHVVFGFLDLKTHCKLSLVVRREGSELIRYVHLGTGNYNPTTALIYTDLGLFTADPDIGHDTSALFNLLTGYSQGHTWRKLIVAPADLQMQTIEMIDEQAQRVREGLPARIFAKLNSLVDHRVIESLYRASMAGVPIHLVVRGICCLRPGVPDLSENIHVTSIVDRFLEHSRIYIFGPDEDARVFLASADWMPRNFHRRVEVMFPVESQELKDRILKELVPVYLRDNVKSREILSDGGYRRVKRRKKDLPLRCQDVLLEQWANGVVLPDANANREPQPKNAEAAEV